MEEALTRQEYPAILARLLPKQTLSDVLDRQGSFEKLNHEVSDWLMERRKIETSYATSLAKLTRKPFKSVSDLELGSFLPAWKKLLAEADKTAHVHYIFAQRVERDVELPLRNFISKATESKEFLAQRNNMASLATAVTSAQRENDKLAQKGGKANGSKVEAATLKLQNANQQWDSQAPFIMETFQVLDEARFNHLREVLTQYQTHEVQMLTDCKRAIERAMNSLLELDTSQEMNNWAQSVTAGKLTIERRARQSSVKPAGSSDLLPPPSSHEDTTSNHSASQDNFKEHPMKRIGTMLSRRRQSVQGGFARASSPNKMPPPFNYNSSSYDGRPSPSPRPSVSNLQESTPQLYSLAESAPALSSPGQTNGIYSGSPGLDRGPRSPPTTAFNASRAGSGDILDLKSLPGPPPSHLGAASEATKDAEGFSVPIGMNDPISQAQQEAAQEAGESQFKLDIRRDPIPEQDADAQAALSNVTNTLRSSVAIAPTRKLGTIRGRRDVRNTMYNPSALDISVADHQSPPSANVPPSASRAGALSALSSPDPAASDTTSIRSGTSLANNVAIKHMDSHLPGLNASIVETVSATFEDGQVKTAKVGGEIALNYISDSGTSPVSPLTGTETIRINNFPNLEAIGPNRTFIHQVSIEKPEQFTIDLSSLSSRSLVAFTYRVHIPDESVPLQGPLLLKPVWKQQGERLDLVIEYSLNPAYDLSPLTLNNLVLVAIYTGAKATTCQTKPSGTHLKDRSLVYWRLGDITATPDWHKIMCRFGGVGGASPHPGHVEARWEIYDSARSGITLSRLESSKAKGKAIDSADPFADGGSNIVGTAPGTVGGPWVDIITNRRLASGIYEAGS